MKSIRRGRRIWICLLLFLPLVQSRHALAVSETKTIPLFIPVRFMSDSDEPSGAHPRWGRDFFRLQINGVQVEVAALHTRIKTLAGESELGRNFILAFHTTEYSPQVEATLDIFLSEIVNSRDTITLVSPTNIYRLPVSADKGGMMTAISSHIHRDLRRFNQEKMKMESNLRRTAMRMRENLQRYYWRYRSTRGGAFKSMFSEFIDMLEVYETKFITPNPILWAKSAAMTGERPGLTWMILFMQSKLQAAIHRWHKILQRVDGPALMVLSNVIADLQDRRPFLFEFPTGDFSPILANGNITLYTLFSNGQPDADDTVEKSLRHLSRQSGGHLFHLQDPGSTIRAIRNHRDTYTEIEAPCKATDELKQIHIVCGDGSPIRHKQLFTSKELAALREQRSGVVIQHINLTKNILVIEIGSYKQTPEGTGIVTIQVELKNPGQPGHPPLFASKKTLRAHRDKLAVYLPIPSPPGRGWWAEITAYDLVANRSTRATFRPPSDR